MQGNTVLLVEDNEKLNEINRRALESEGCTVLTALTLACARAHLKSCRPGVILLDVMLPDGDGIDFCREIRSGTDAHILFLTSRLEHADRIRGLDTGGDDYITKPYKLDEMLSRVRAVLRRRSMDKSPAQILEKGSLTLDMAASQAFIGGVNLELTPKEFSLLFLLLRHYGEALNKTLLYEEVWKQPLAGDGRTLWQHMSRLKRKLEAASDSALTVFTVRGEGYSLEMIEAE